MSRRIVPIAVLSVFALLSDDARGESQLAPKAQTIEAADSVLFHLVIQLLQEEAENSRSRLIIDARPLRNDSRIVTLSKALPLVVPEFVSVEAHEDVLLRDEFLSRQRRNTLTRAKVVEGDASAYASCPPLMLPETPERSERKQQLCPAEPTHLAFIALPRRGGAYWPENFDERTKHGESAQSVRVILTTASHQGRNQVSVDYVFALTGGRWELRERRPLLIVE